MSPERIARFVNSVKCINLGLGVEGKSETNKREVTTWICTAPKGDVLKWDIRT